MLAFLQSQPNLIERLLRHIETPSFVDLIGRITQLDEAIPNSNVLEVRRVALQVKLRLVEWFYSGCRPRTLWAA